MISAGKGHLSHQFGVVLARRRGSFADLEASGQRRRERREGFPGQTGAIVPRGEWVAPVEPHHPDGRRGGRPVGCERMPGTCLPRVWSRLSDEACEDAVPGPGATRRLVGIDVTPGQVPDATTLPEFRHLLGGEGLGEGMLAEPVPVPGGRGVITRGAPSSTPPSPGPPPRRGAGGARATRGPARRGGATTGTSGTRRTRASTRGRASRARRGSPPRTRRTWPWRRRRRAPTTSPATLTRATRAWGSAPRPGATPPPRGWGGASRGAARGSRGATTRRSRGSEGQGAPPPVCARGPGTPSTPSRTSSGPGGRGAGAREEPQPALRRLRARGPRPARAGGKDPGPCLRVGSPGPRRGREPTAGRRAARPEAPTRRPQVPRRMKSTHRPI